VAISCLYALVLLLTPFTHDDLVCHLKNPYHCTACAATPPATGVTMAPAIGAWQLSDAGSAPENRPLSKGVLLPAKSTGRSPPVTA
jgi:hypothetical protein